MNQYPSAMIAFEQCTIDSGYGHASTLSAPVEMSCGFSIHSHRSTIQLAVSDIRVPLSRSVDEFGQTISVPFTPSASSETASVTVRVRDIAHGLKSMTDAQLAWIEDLGDDPIVLTSDFYEVFLACQKIIEERRRAG